jgi:hypothetical protein
VKEHLQAARENLYAWTERAWTIMKTVPDESARTLAFTTFAAEEFRRQLPDEKATARYVAVGMPPLSWLGLERYWRKRVEAQEKAATDS